MVQTGGAGHSAANRVSAIITSGVNVSSQMIVTGATTVSTIIGSGLTITSNVSIAGVTSVASLTASGMTITSQMGITGGLTYVTATASGLTITSNMGVSGAVTIQTATMSGMTITSVMGITGTLNVASQTTSGLNITSSLTILGAQLERRNVIINGDMAIAQRGTSFVSPATNAYTLDRWTQAIVGSTGVVTITQDTDVPTVAEAGCKFNYSLKVDVTTADTDVAAGDRAHLRHSVEGYNVRKLMGQSVTLSFWVKSVKTGIYCIAFAPSINDYNYVAEYTINSASTWEKKTITLTWTDGATGTWNYTNGIGINLMFELMEGSTKQGTANIWTASDIRATSNQVNFFDSTDNNFWLTGVQLEVGSVATAFESRLIDQEVNANERYMEQSYNITSAPGTITSSGALSFVSRKADQLDRVPVSFRVSKRAAPTMTIYSPISGSAGYMQNFTSASEVAVTVENVDITGFNLVPTANTVIDCDYRFHYTAISEL